MPLLCTNTPSIHDRDRSFRIVRLCPIDCTTALCSFDSPTSRTPLPEGRLFLFFEIGIGPGSTLRRRMPQPCTNLPSVHESVPIVRNTGVTDGAIPLASPKYTKNAGRFSAPLPLRNQIDRLSCFTDRRSTNRRSPAALASRLASISRHAVHRFPLVGFACSS